MTNINLLPKPGMSLEQIIADTDDGLYLKHNRSLEHRRPATELPVRHGGRQGGQGRQARRLLKNPTYTGITYEFWRSCDAVGDQSSYRMLGTPNCGKGEPGQVAHVGHAVQRRPLPRRSGGSRQVVIETKTVDSLALAERAIELALATGATQAEAVVMRTDEALTRFANSQIHQNVSESNTALNLRFVEGKRIGVASTNRLDDDSLKRLAEQAAAIARLQPERVDFGGLPEPGPIPHVEGTWSRETAEATPSNARSGHAP